MDICLIFVIVAVFLCKVTGRELTNAEQTWITQYEAEHGGDKVELVKGEAWMTFNNTLTFDLSLYFRNHECVQCSPIFESKILAGSTHTVVVETTFGTDVVLKKSGTNETTICSVSNKFRENGNYWLFLDQSNVASLSCDYGITNNPMAAEMPILFAACGIVILWITVKVVAHLYKKYGKDPDLMTSYNLQKKSNSYNMGKQDVEKSSAPKRERLKSLDTFRGLSLMIMVFVNYGGGGYWFFEHLPWNGLTVADLVFPWFVFIMGTSMNYSFKGMFKRGRTRGQILVKVIRRTALLFGFGIMLNTNWGPVNLSMLRVPGVLQRLALSYLVVALLQTAFARRQDTYHNRSWAWIRDVVLYIPQWIVGFCILATYLALTFALPVPGCPTGYLGPGGLHDNQRYQNCTGGSAGYIDRWVLGENHLYSNPTCKKIYKTTVNYDPEGILGTLTSAFLCFLGLHAGRIFVTFNEPKSRVIRLSVCAIITGITGGALCEFSLNDGLMPINKNLWSVSFILVTASLGFILLSILYVVIDVMKWWDGAPFIYPGMNPLLIFLCHDIFYRMFPVNWVIKAIHWKLLLQEIWDVTIYLTLAFVLYRKKIFFTI